MPSVRFLTFIVLLGLGSASSAQPRLWRDTGGRTLTGSYLTSNDEHAFLKLKSGKISEIPLGLLSNKDLEFVRAKRATLSAQGIRYEAPLVWTNFRSKKFTSSQVEKLGYYPLESDDGEGTLTLKFRRYGPPPDPKARIALRIHTAGNRGSRTSSPIRVYLSNTLVGSINGANANDQIDIPLNASVLSQGENIDLTVRCGTDAVFLRAKGTGQGPRLIVLR